MISTRRLCLRQLRARDEKLNCAKHLARAPPLLSLKREGAPSAVGCSPFLAQRIGTACRTPPAPARRAGDGARAGGVRVGHCLGPTASRDHRDLRGRADGRERLLVRGGGLDERRHPDGGLGNDVLVLTRVGRTRRGALDNVSGVERIALSSTGNAITPVGRSCISARRVSSRGRAGNDRVDAPAFGATPALSVTPAATTDRCRATTRCSPPRLVAPSALSDFRGGSFTRRHGAYGARDRRGFGCLAIGFFRLVVLAVNGSWRRCNPARVRRLARRARRGDRRHCGQRGGGMASPACGLDAGPAPRRPGLVSAVMFVGGLSSAVAGYTRKPTAAAALQQSTEVQVLSGGLRRSALDDGACDSGRRPALAGGTPRQPDASGRAPARLPWRANARASACAPR